MTDPAMTLRAELLETLAANRASVCDALRAELTRVIELEHGRLLQFEVDPWSWDISSCASEERVTEADWLSVKLPDWVGRAGDAGLNWDETLSEAVCPWFADCWQTVGGPAQFSPAYLFIHGYHHRQYDLERRCWVSASVAFGE